jgi:hypothetical protein
MHSRHWTAFFDELSTNDRITKRWTLCVPAGTIVYKGSEVRRTWEFRRQRAFITRYCAADQVERPLGRNLPAYDVIEDYGNYVKFLSLPKGSYAPSETGMVLTTIFKPDDAWARQLLATIDDSAEEMNERWVEKYCASSSPSRESSARHD